jgi:hypothetical protein
MSAWAEGSGIAIGSAKLSALFAPPSAKTEKAAYADASLTMAVLGRLPLNIEIADGAERPSAPRSASEPVKLT